MAYLSGPTFVAKRCDVHRRDFVALLNRLEFDMPGYQFELDNSAEGGIVITSFPGYHWGHKDLVFLLSILRRCLRRCCPIVSKIVKDFLSYPSWGYDSDSPYKVIRMHGLHWPGIIHDQSRRHWATSHECLLNQGDKVYTCLKAFQKAPPWTADELERLCIAFEHVLGLEPEYWRRGRSFVTRSMQKRLKESQGNYW